MIGKSVCVSVPLLSLTGALGADSDVILRAVVAVVLQSLWQLYRSLHKQDADIGVETRR
jgi:hypothetical protein